MAQQITLTAERRADKGSPAARRLRAKGRVPAVIYGHGRPPEALSVSQAELEKALIGVAAASTVIDLTMDGKPVKTLIREIQRTAVRREILHVDFYEIHADEKIKLKVPVHLVGTPDGVRNAGGVLDQVLREIEIEVLPTQIPERIELDVSALTIGKSLHVRDITLEHATILTHLDETVCTVVPPRIEEVVAPAPEAAVEVAEPELIRKPRAEEEAGEGEEAAAEKPEKPEKPEKAKSEKSKE
jgi:large subunit ribosomal protein L25